MMIVECGIDSFSASTGPNCAWPWSSLCRPVRIRSNFCSAIAAVSAAPP
jgi:hypothetical protein